MKCRLNCTIEVKHSLFKDIFSSSEKHQGHDSESGWSQDWYQEKPPRSNCRFSLEHRKQVEPLHLVLIWPRLFLIMYLEFLFWAQVNSGTSVLHLRCNNTLFSKGILYTSHYRMSHTEDIRNLSGVTRRKKKTKKTARLSNSIMRNSREFESDTQN